MNVSKVVKRYRALVRTVLELVSGQTCIERKKHIVSWNDDNDTTKQFYASQLLLQYRRDKKIKLIIKKEDKITKNNIQGP